MDPEDGTLWALGRILRRPRAPMGALRKNNITATSDADKAEMLAESLYAVTDGILDNDRKQTLIINKLNIYKSRPGTEIPPATVDEISALIKNLDKRKAPGLDGITNFAAKHLPKNVIVELTNIINEILQTSTFPNQWKTAKVIFILKSGKPRPDPESYRPISLLSTLGKIAERVILDRLNEQIEDLNLIPPEQFGFRRSHGTELQLLRLVEEIHAALDRKDVANAVFLDITRAFDTVWHDGLIAKLYQYKINPTVVRLIQSYIQNRHFVVSVGAAISSSRALRAGLPQGSVISPIAYNLYTADFPKSDASRIYAYADDLAIVSTGRSERHVHNCVQYTLNRANRYFKKWKLSPHPAKTQHIIFSNRRDTDGRRLFLNQEPIPNYDTVKYLGILLDRKLTWNPQITEAAKKGRKAIGMLYPMIGPGNKLSLPNKILMYRQIVRPAITYGGLTWGTAAPTLIKKLQVVQNNYLRISVSAPPRTNMTRLQNELGVMPISQFIRESSIKKLEKAELHENLLVTQALDYQTTLRPRRNRPKSALFPPQVP